jgi:hypothetical protein
VVLSLGRGAIASLGVLLASVLLAATPGVAAAQSPVAISLQAHPATSISSHRVTLTGRVSGAPTGAVVDLYKIPYPYTSATLVRTTVPSPSGAFSFEVFPDRKARYRALVAGTGAQAVVQIEVFGRVQIKVHALPLGQAQVTVVVFHPRDLRWGDATVNWWFASGGPFMRAQSTKTLKLSPYVVMVSTTITLPAGPFRWRACFHAAGDHALLDARLPSGCGGQGYSGGGTLPVGFPGPAAIARAEAYLNSRGGHTALAVVDSEGRESGIRIHDTFITGSAVKAMLLVAYLRHLDAIGQHYIDGYSASFLYPMINVSDNSAATTCWSIVGDGGLYALANAAGMTDFSISGIWANAFLSAADQAKFFFEMDSLVPPEFDGYARFLLSNIAGYESWGIPAIARPLGYNVYFKGGWRPSPDIYLVHQIARLEGHGVTFSMAVMTDGDADMGYGIDTIQGVTAALLG